MDAAHRVARTARGPLPAGPLAAGRDAPVRGAEPVAVPPPGDDDAWATRVVLGERRWLAGPASPLARSEDSRWSSSRLDADLVAVAAPVNLDALRSAIRRDATGTVLGTALSLALTLLFFARMARLYETREG